MVPSVIRKAEPAEKVGALVTGVHGLDFAWRAAGKAARTAQATRLRGLKVGRTDRSFG
jgi:hypothetical protein